MIFFSLLFCTEPDTSPSFEPLPKLPEKVLEKERPRHQSTGQRQALISLVGEVRGEIEPCGCPTLPFGGFARRKTFFQQLPNNLPHFHLDAGELLLKGFSGKSRDPSKQRAELMLELSHTVGVDVIAVGPTDIQTLGIETLQQYKEISLISASFMNKKGDLLFAPFKVIEKQNFRLAVIGLSERPSAPKIREIIQYVPPQKAIKTTLPLIPADVDLIVVLGSVDDEAIQGIANKDIGVSAFLTTRGSAYEEAYKAKDDGPLIIETPERGRYIQSIYIQLDTSSHIPLELSTLEQPWRDRIMGQKNPTSDQKILLESQGRNIAYIELNPLNEVYETQSLSYVEEKLEAYKKFQLEQAAQIAAQEPTEEDVGFASSGSCAGCHSKEFARWTFTKHAHAWQSLLIKEEQNNPECIACHSTGFGEVGGLGALTQSNLRKFKSVQCESCHGPLKGHPDDKNVISKPITPQSCLVCHDEANSPNFSFSSYLSMASCQME